MEIRVKTRKGVFKGAENTLGVCSFKGIPFALSPVGERRFLAPVQTEDSETEFEALEFGNNPMQDSQAPVYGELPMGEDCLYLNIWTGDIKLLQKPVLVWVYGGAYIKGGANRPQFDGTALTAENRDILFVTMNYRLGVLGNLNLSPLGAGEKYRDSNNLARLDLQMCLKWIYENIEAFGGDPENVTLMGHSAGSSNITAQLMMEQSRPYFRKIIAHSSFALDVGICSLEENTGTAELFFRNAGIKTMDELLGCSAGRLMTEQARLLNGPLRELGRKPFSVVKDKIHIPEDAFRRIAQGSAKNVRMILGTASGEYDKQFLKQRSTEDMYRFLASQCGEKLNGIAAAAGNFRNHGYDRTVEEMYMDIKNDLWLRVPANILAEAMSRHSAVFMYYTRWRNPQTGDRAPHGFEFPLVLNHYDRSLVDEKMADTVRRAWLEFVRNGTPVLESGLEWPQYESTKRDTLIIDEPLSVQSGVRVKDLQYLSPCLAEWYTLMATV